MKLVNTAMVAASAGGSSPTVFALVLDDLLTRHYPGTDQRFKLTATAGTTDWIESDDNATIYSAAAMATDMQTKLRALTGYSGKVTVSGASTEAGDKYTFTITFDGSLGVVTLAFHASSQFYPTITLTEAVTQQGAAAVNEVATITASGADDTTFDNNGNSVTLDSEGTYLNASNGAGWTITSNPLTGTATFTCDTPGPKDSSKMTGSGTVTLDVTGVTGQPEIHTITPTPVNPTGGTYSLIGSPDMDYDQVGPSPSGGGWSSTSLGVNNKLSTGTLEFTNSVNGDVADDSLTPVNVSLTAPEITHSVS